MKRKKRSTEEIEAELDALESLSHAELKEQWNELYGVPCPKHMSRKFLLGAVAYRIQENAFGGLKKSTKRRLQKIAADVAAGKPLKKPGLKIKPGTRLLREWNGAVHEVTVLDNGVEYRGESWPSLSAVAREITGARWSGPRFFGLKEATRG
ncbi:MAG: DUF2924 domain-containing protein [Planctomycetota bacterium]